MSKAFGAKTFVIFAVVFFLAFCTHMVPVPAGEMSALIPARVLVVIDGDTILVRASPWPGLQAVEKVRLLGIDTPEIRGACDHEKALAVEAKARLARLAGARVWLSEIGRDRYGRLLARVYGASGELGAAMISAGLARAYDGKGRRKPWC